MKEKPLVSIILVNYNGMKDTTECIDSLQQITYPNYNIVILDNGSTKKEELPDRYRPNDKIHFIKSEENLGFAGGNNAACRYAIKRLNAEYVLLLNNDTIVTAPFLENMMRCALSCGPKTVVTGKIYYESDRSKLWYAGGRIDIKKGLAVHYTNDDWHNNTQYPRVSFASGCLVLLPSDAIKATDGIPEEYFLYYEDVAFSIELRKRGYAIRYCPDAVIYHKVNASTGTKSDLSVYYGTRNRFYFIKQYGKNKPAGYLSTYLMALRSVIRHPTRFNVVKGAIVDYSTGRMGRSEGTRKKICFVLTGYSIVPTGGHRIIYEYANRLAEHDDVTLLFLNDGFFDKKYLPRFVRKMIIDYNTKKEPNWFDIDSRVKKVSFFGREKITEKMRDYVFIATAVETAKKTQRYADGKKAYYFIQDFENWNCEDEEVYETYRLGLTPVVISHWLKELVDRYSPIKSILLQNPIDVNEYRYLTPIDKRKTHTIGLLYHESEHKGLKYAMEAIRKLKGIYEELEVYMFGTATEPLELPEWIKYTRNASREQTVKIYNSVTVFLCATVEEGFGLTGMEAMACGCVLVSTEYKGVKEYAISGVNALLSPVKDVDSLVDNVRRVFENEELRKRLSCNAIRDSAGRGWEEQTGRLKEILELV